MAAANESQEIVVPNVAIRVGRAKRIRTPNATAYCTFRTDITVMPCTHKFVT